MWLYSDGPEDPEDDAVMEKHGADLLYSAVNSMMHAILITDDNTQTNVAHRSIWIA